VTIHKVAISDKEQLAVSRSFGDFEYKLNTTLGPEEQAASEHHSGEQGPNRKTARPYRYGHRLIG
jgi:hypothetical protein